MSIVDGHMASMMDGPLDDWMDGCDERERRSKGLFGCMDAVRARVTHLNSHSLITAWLTLHRPKVSNFSYPPPFLHPVSAKVVISIQ